MPRVEVAEILAAARTWLGTPWRHQGRLKGVAVDCGGLILGVGRELGLLDFDTRAYGRIPDGQQLRALCEQHLVSKPVARLEQARFVWPRIEDGVMRRSPGQLGALFEGLDWKRVHSRRVARPQLAP